MKTIAKLGASAVALAASTALTAPSAFADQGRNAYGGEIISCSSHRNRTVSCALPRGARGADVRLIRRHSSAGCREGSDWGVSRNAIWVSNGCRADFEVFSARDDRRGGGDVLLGGRGDRDWRRDRNDRRDGDYRGGRYSRPTQDGAVEVCYRAMNRELGGRRYWSIQYDGEPRLREDRRGYELRGRVRMHGPRGFSHLETVCELNGNRVVRFYVDR